MSDNVLSADNQQGSLPIYYRYNPSETTRRTPFSWNREEILAYLHGAMHDASLNKKRRVQFVQKYLEWLEMIQNLLEFIKVKSWIYKEGKDRNLYVLETTCPELHFDFDPLILNSRNVKIAYVRGFFDAEGGTPRNNKRFYIQLVQKDYKKIESLKKILSELGIYSGTIHNPSKKIDPNYWRIFISSRGYFDFVSKIGSYHPIKSKIFQEWMMI